MKIRPVTVDISRLAWMVHRMDISATLKSFTVAFAFLTAIMNVATVFSFVAAVFVHDNDDLETWMFVTAVVLTGTFVALTPLGFLVWDWMARKPWKQLAAIVGGLLGGLLVGLSGLLLAVGVIAVPQSEHLSTLPDWLVSTGVSLLSLMLLISWMTARPGRLSKMLGWTIGLLLAAVALFAVHFLVEYWIHEQPMLRGGEYLYILAVLVALASICWVLVRAVRHRIVLSGDVPREMVLGALQRKGFWARLAFLTGLPSSLWHAAAMRTPAFWGFLLARPLVYAGVLWLIKGEYQPTKIMATLIIGLLMIVAGHILFAIAKRLATWHIWSPEDSGECESPILFLRSFQDDQLAFRRPWWRLDDHWFDLWSFRRNADQAMIDEIAQYGPVVALGVPGENRIPFGAQRHYAAHDDWKEVIADTARRSKAVVISASASPSVIWEYQMLAAEGLLDKVLLLFPIPDKSHNSSQALLETFNDATGIGIEVEPKSERRLIAVLPSSQGHTALLATKATAEAYVVALRAHFQHCPPELLEDLITEDQG